MNKSSVIINWERQVQVLAKEQMPKFRAKVEELVRELAKFYPIRSLSMRGGTYFFSGYDVGVVHKKYPNDKDYYGHIPIIELLAWFQHRHQSYDRPKNYTQDQEKIFEELIEVLDFLTNSSYLGLFDIIL